MVSVERKNPKTTVKRCNMSVGGKNVRVKQSVKEMEKRSITATKKKLQVTEIRKKVTTFDIQPRKNNTSSGKYTRNYMHLS